MKGKICYLFDGCPALVIAESDKIWANTFSVIPLETTLFYEEGKVEIELQEQVKFIDYEK